MKKSINLPITKNQVFLQEDVDGSLVYNYDLETVGSSAVLKYSTGTTWSTEIVGDVAADVVDDGDLMYFNLSNYGDTIILDYIQAQQLLILLMNDNKSLIQIRDYNVLKSLK